MTKLLALGGLGAAAFAAVRVRRRAAEQRELDELDYELDAYEDFDAPIVVTEEVIVVTEPEEIEQAASTAEGQGDQEQQQPPVESTLADFQTPGRGAPPR